mgnify:CR=1 FL=1
MKEDEEEEVLPQLFCCLLSPDSPSSPELLVPTDKGYRPGLPFTPDPSLSSGPIMSATAAAIEPLLSDDGDITAKVRPSPPRAHQLTPTSTQFEAVLQQVFRRYASSLPSDSSPSPSAPPAPLDTFSNAFTLSREDLNRFASDTNGQRISSQLAMGSRKGADESVQL